MQGCLRHNVLSKRFCLAKRVWRCVARSAPIVRRGTSPLLLVAGLDQGLKQALVHRVAFAPGANVGPSAKSSERWTSPAVKSNDKEDVGSIAMAITDVKTLGCLC